jgi:hypothetical protein
MNTYDNDQGNNLYAPVNQNINNTNQANVINTNRLHVNNNEKTYNYDYYNVPENYYVKVAMKEYKACPSKVANSFFSVTNIKLIQQQLKDEVLKRSYGKFILHNDQNVQSLLLGMMGIFKLYSKNLPIKIKKQVAVLNKRTIQFIAPDIVVNIKQDIEYRRHINNPIKPIHDPINTNTAGRKTLPGPAQLLGL